VSVILRRNIQCFQQKHIFFLDKYRGLAFLDDCYDIEHTQSIQTAVDDMTEVCVRHGGVLA
jgi:hypothetical protein